MNENRYSYSISEDYATFEFESLGPKGSIGKVVEFTLFDKFDDGTPMLNLAFGDLIGYGNSFSDTAKSNNGDRQKVLATVASIVLDITDRFGNVAVYAEGSTATRTRLYQMGINAFKNEIEARFSVKGLTTSGWEKFKSGVNYSAFLVTRKNIKLVENGKQDIRISQGN